MIRQHAKFYSGLLVTTVKPNGNELNPPIRLLFYIMQKNGIEAVDVSDICHHTVSQDPALIYANVFLPPQAFAVCHVDIKIWWGFQKYDCVRM
jgi:hypothetical protein